MASEAVIKLSLEDQELLSDLKKVGGGFDSVANKVEKVERNTDKLAKSANTAGNMFKGFLTLEMAKKIGAFADQTLRAADEMDNLSLEARDASKTYIESIDSLKQLSQTFVFGIAKAVGPALKLLGESAKEATEYWSQIFGVGEDAEQNKANEITAKLNETRALVRTHSNEMKKITEKLNGYLSDSDREFYNKRLSVVKYTLDSELAREKEYTTQLENQYEKRKQAEEKNRQASIKKNRNVSQSAEVKQQKETSEKIVEIKDEELETLLKLQQQYDDAQLARLDDEIQAYNEAEQEKADDEIANREEIAEIRQKIELKNQQMLDEAEQRDNERRKKRVQDELEANATIMQSAGTMFGGMSKLTAEFNKESKEWTKMSLSLAEIEAIANTAAGVTMAYRQGSVAGLFAGVGIAAAGAAQVVQIEKQKQKLWDGGIVKGPTSGDTVEVRANGGEMMLTRQDQVGLLGLIRNGGNGGGTTVNAYFQPSYTKDTPAIDKMRDNKEFLRTIKTLQSDPAYKRISGALV